MIKKAKNIKNLFLDSIKKENQEENKPQELTKLISHLHKNYTKCIKSAKKINKLISNKSEVNDIIKEVKFYMEIMQNNSQMYEIFENYDKESLKFYTAEMSILSTLISKSLQLQQTNAALIESKLNFANDKLKIIKNLLETNDSKNNYTKDGFKEKPSNSKRNTNYILNNKA